MSAKIGASVFLVEDEALIVAYLSECLTGAGYQVVGSTGLGERALDLIPVLSPDVILMDVRLAGGLDGIGVALALRSRCDAPVVFLTASHEGETRNRACVAAPYGFLTKPARRDSVVAAVDAALARRRYEISVSGGSLPSACEDIMTGLPNRQQFISKVNGWAAGSEKSVASVCLCDLDSFQAVYDQSGNEGVNRLLRHFASLLRASAGGAELLCRMEGHRFCIVYPNVGVTEAAGRIQDIGHAFAEDCRGKDTPVTATFGIALMKTPEDDIEAALHEADHRLRYSKRRGGDSRASDEDTSSGDLLALYGRLGGVEPVASLVTANRSAKT